MPGSDRHFEWKHKQLMDKCQGIKEYLCVQICQQQTPELDGGRVPSFVGNALQVFEDQIILKPVVRAGLGSKHPSSHRPQILKCGRGRRFHLGLILLQFCATTSGTNGFHDVS